MRTLYALTAFLLAVIMPVLGQEQSLYLQDSIYVDQGISGTLDFEPERRIYFPSYDDRGRVLEEVRQAMDPGGVWRPKTRRMFTYEGDHLTQMHIQAWSIEMNSWLDMRKDQYQYEDGMLQEYIRQKAPSGQLFNDRRWLYDYNNDGEETEVLLQQWNGAGWENLSRKVIDYAPEGDLKMQTLQVWMNEAWRNVRAREWFYENTGNRNRVQATIVRVWSSTKNDWEDNLRKVFFYNDDGLWVRSRFEDWQEGAQEWVNADRMVNLYNAQNQPVGQFLQTWDGQWENRGQVSYTFTGDQFFSRIEVWDKVQEEWRNFLRYWAEFDDRDLLSSRTGMQAWNAEQMAWENRSFTRQHTYFWSEEIVNSVKEAQNFSSCNIPNPYPGNTYFFCDLPPARKDYQLELYDMLGRPVYRRSIQSGQATAIETAPAPGVYVLRIRDDKQLYHLQKLIIH